MIFYITQQHDSPGRLRLSIREKHRNRVGFTGWQLGEAQHQFAQPVGNITLTVHSYTVTIERTNIIVSANVLAHNAKTERR